MTAFGIRPMSQIVVALLFVAAASFAANEVQASCGDYLVIGGAEHQMGSAGDPPGAEASDSPVDTGCDGPQCRRAPGLPAPPLPVRTTVNQDEQAHLAHLSERHRRRASWYCAAEASLRPPTGFPSRLERPPRA